MNRLPFATLVFKGPRFESHLMPLDALPELAAYRHLLLEVARCLFRNAHPDRQRVRKNFDAGLNLVLGTVERGSAAPSIERLVEPACLMPLLPDDQDYFESARFHVQDAIEHVSQGHPIPQAFPKDAIPSFNPFGRTLGRAEAIVVAPAGSQQGATYSKEIRKRLLLSYQSKYEDDVELGGVVRAADYDGEKFWLRTDGEKRIQVRCSPLFLPAAFRAGVTGIQRVNVKGTGLWDRDDQLLEVSHAEQVTLDEDVEAVSCPTPIADQILALGELHDGWLDGKGVAPKRALLPWLTELLVSVVVNFNLPVPFIYPTPEGAARAEWPSPRWEVVAEIDTEKRTAKVYAIDLTGDKAEESTLDFSRPGGETNLGRFVADHVATTNR